MVRHTVARPLWPLYALLILGLLAAAPCAAQQFPPPTPPGAPQPGVAPAPAAAAPSFAPLPNGSIVHKVQAANDRLEMIVTTSRILTLDQRIPQAQVNNPDVLELTPLSPNQVQISAKKQGVTQVNLWTEDKKVYSIDVIVTGDARELAMILRAQFPKSALNIMPVGNTVIISGTVDQQDAVPRIMQIAEVFYPPQSVKVINNMTVSGVQQAVLQVKIMEVSRTKLRKLGFDFTVLNSGTNMFTSGAAGILSIASGEVIASGADPSAAFHILSGSSAFFGVLEALRNDKLAKIHAEPNLVAVSGRPAYFLAGGELGYLVSNGLSGNTVEFKEYGTRVDFVPIVLGNGRMRLEVRARISDKDKAESIAGVPALKTREVDTGVEMRAGQTLAIAGLVQQRTEAEVRGLPWISEVPYLGAAFRKTNEEINEIEVLILITPQFIEPLDPCQVPPCGPGMSTTSPNDCELLFKAHLEVPICCPNCHGCGCGACGNTGQQGGPPPEGMLLGPRLPAHSGVASGDQRIPYNPTNPTAPAPRPTAPRPTAARPAVEPGLIGPIGYDVVN